MQEQSASKNRYVWVAIGAAMLVAGIGIGYAVFTPSYHSPMMNNWLRDPSTRQQVMSQMMQNPQFMQEWMANQQFQQNWMYPYMMQNWRMGTGMGPGMMGGSVIGNGNGVNQATSQAVATNEVSISLNSWNPRLTTTTSYQPLHIVVKAGTTVTWTNNDSVLHTVTDANNSFDSNLISPNGGAWSHTFNNAGTYNYYCTIHTWMRGTVDVNG